MLRNIAGKHTANSNIAEKNKAQNPIIRDHLTVSNNRRKVEGWVPKWLRFPATSYTARPFATLAKWKDVQRHVKGLPAPQPVEMEPRSEEHTSELQSLMRISYAVFCLKKKTNTQNATTPIREALKSNATKN